MSNKYAATIYQDGTSDIQSVLFDINRYTVNEAIIWLKKHKLKSNKVDITKRYLRFRQHDPNLCDHFRTISTDVGIKLIICFHHPQPVGGAQSKRRIVLYREIKHPKFKDGRSTSPWILFLKDYASKHKLNFQFLLKHLYDEPGLFQEYEIWKDNHNIGIKTKHKRPPPQYSIKEDLFIPEESPQQENIPQEENIPQQFTDEDIDKFLNDEF